MRFIRNRKGFTLIELMVVVIIVAILAGISVPLYQKYVQEGKKAEAYAVLDSAVAGAKVYFHRNRTYVGGTLTAWRAQDDVDNADYFTYSISNLTATGFTATATLTGGWGPAGATITWTQTGASAANGSPGSGAFAENGW